MNRPSPSLAINMEKAALYLRWAQGHLRQACAAAEPPLTAPLMDVYQGVSEELSQLTVLRQGVPAVGGAETPSLGPAQEIPPALAVMAWGSRGQSQQIPPPGPDPTAGAQTELRPCGISFEPGPGQTVTLAIEDGTGHGAEAHLSIMQALAAAHGLILVAEDLTATAGEEVSS